jgi:hypothetical protein
MSHALTIQSLMSPGNTGSALSFRIIPNILAKTIVTEESLMWWPGACRPCDSLVEKGQARAGTSIQLSDAREDETSLV